MAAIQLHVSALWEYSATKWNCFVKASKHTFSIYLFAYEGDHYQQFTIYYFCGRVQVDGSIYPLRFINPKKFQY